MSDTLHIRIGTELFEARLRPDLAPRSCECLLGMLPLVREAIHARWSGEALWSPLAETFPEDLILPPERAEGEPAPGQILLYAGPLSEPELLMPYGTSRFACKAGALRGNPVITLQGRLERLTRLGREVLWGGARPLRIEVYP